MAQQNALPTESLVVCQDAQGNDLRGFPTRLTRHQVVFEIHGVEPVLRTSEVLNEFKVTVQDRSVYSGRALVTNLLNASTGTSCEVKLDEAGFTGPWFAPAKPSGLGFPDFLEDWQRLYRVLPEFKGAIVDMQSFLSELRLALDQVELEVRSVPSDDRARLEREAVSNWSAQMLPAFNVLHENLESISGTIPEELRPVHQVIAKRLLHPIVMCSPFAYRTFHKPLGYAGDYEMVNMIVRDPFEGGSLFAKVMNSWFLNQWPARAHRNRIGYLKKILKQECIRGAREGRQIRILNLGCGPAREIQEFLAEEEVSNYAHFTLLDFNDETLRHAAQVLEDARRSHARRTAIVLQRKSVQHVLREACRRAPTDSRKGYDLIYCAGLFDYLSDRVCRQLMSIFYDWLSPGGLLAATNVDDRRPFRHMLEFVLDWHLIYRTSAQGSSLLPPEAQADAPPPSSDPTAVNIFVEARKN